MLQMKFYFHWLSGFWEKMFKKVDGGWAKSICCKFQKHLFELWFHIFFSRLSNVKAWMNKVDLVVQLANINTGSSFT